MLEACYTIPRVRRQEWDCPSCPTGSEISFPLGTRLQTLVILCQWSCEDTAVVRPLIACSSHRRPTVPSASSGRKCRGILRSACCVAIRYIGRIASAIRAARRQASTTISPDGTIHLSGDTPKYLRRWCAITRRPVAFPAMVAAAKPSAPAPLARRTGAANTKHPSAASSLVVHGAEVCRISTEYAEPLARGREGTRPRSAAT